MPRLCDPAQLGPVTVANRIVFPATGARIPCANGVPTAEFVEFYARRARGGAGLVFSTWALVNRRREGTDHLHTRGVFIDRDEQIAGWAKLAEAVHAQGGRAGLQLSCTFPCGDGQPNPRLALMRAGPNGDWFNSVSDMVQSVTGAEIEQVIAEYVEGALRAAECGLDALEFRFCHGDPVHQFMSPLTNRRQDLWGRDLAGRIRLPLEIVRRTRARLKRPVALGCRLSVGEFPPEPLPGLELDEVLAAAQQLEQAGLDYVSLSAGSRIGYWWVIQPATAPNNLLVDYARQFKQRLRIPVIVAGRIRSPQAGERILASGDADLIAYCRALLADPDMPLKYFSGNRSEIQACLTCNTCWDLEPRRTARSDTTDGFDQAQRKAPRLLCAVNPSVVAAQQLPARTQRPGCAVAVGADPSNLEFARLIAAAGHKMVLYLEPRTERGRWLAQTRGVIKPKLEQIRRHGGSIREGLPCSAAELLSEGPALVRIAHQVDSAIPSILESSRTFTFRHCFPEAAALEGTVAVIGENQAALQMARVLLRNTKVAAVSLLYPFDAVPGVGLDRTSRDALIQLLDARGVRFVGYRNIVGWIGGELLLQDGPGLVRRLAVDAAIYCQPNRRSERLAALAGECRSLGLELRETEECAEPRLAINAIVEGEADARAFLQAWEQRTAVAPTQEVELSSTRSV